MGRTRARKTSAGITLDTGALIALDRGDQRMIALLRQALAQGFAFRVPSGVLGQAWRDGRVQVTVGDSCGARKLRLFLLTRNLPVPAENSAAPPTRRILSTRRW